MQHAFKLTTAALVQESLVSHGCTKPETAYAEQLFIKLQEEEAEAAVSGSADLSQRAAQVLRSSVGSAAKGSPSARDASATQDGAAEPSGSAAGSGSSSARDAGTTPRTAAAAAAAAAAAPKAGQTNQLLDFDMFEQLWLSDLTGSSGKG